MNYYSNDCCLVVWDRRQPTMAVNWNLCLASNIESQLKWPENYRKVIVQWNIVDRMMIWPPLFVVLSLRPYVQYQRQKNHPKCRIFSKRWKNRWRIWWRRCRKRPASHSGAYFSSFWSYWAYLHWCFSAVYNDGGANFVAKKPKVALWAER